MELNERERRLSLNEAMFRQVNERIDELGENVGLELLEIVCECDQIDCTDRFQIGHDAYEELRADPTTFAVVPGHHARGVEKVIRHEDGYDVVRKHEGEPAEIARATSPRS